jgi:hypothetical protein
MNIKMLFHAVITTLLFNVNPVAGADESLRFSHAADGSFSFDTGVLSGTLRREGRSIGLVPVTFIGGGEAIAAGEGFFNHYRVFTRGKRYGYGARRWPSTAELRADGSVEATWPSTPERPFELRSTYTWASPDTLDVVTTVRAGARLEAFEVFLASYYTSGFTDSLVWASHDPRGGREPGFLSADRQLGEWLAFPRDPAAAAVIDDGRWDLGSSPLEWTMMPEFALPLAVRRDPDSGLAVISMARREDCFGIFTPYGEEKHYSNYLSLFGNDIEAGEAASTRTRLVVLPAPTEADILEATREFMGLPGS